MSSSGYGSTNGQRHPAQKSNYEAPACVQNAMMTKDKKPFTYTPGGIDLSQIKSERMAKRLQRNAQAEGATGQAQRPQQPQQSPGAAPSAAAQIGAAGMGMPFQVLPPPPPPQQGMAGLRKVQASVGSPNQKTPESAESVERYQAPAMAASPEQQQKSPTPQTTPIASPQPPAANIPAFQAQKLEAPQASQAPPAPQASHSPMAEFRSVPRPQSPAVHVYTRQSEMTPSQPRNSDSPFKFNQHQQHMPQSPYSPEMPEQVPTPPSVTTAPAAEPSGQSVPWRTQRSQEPPKPQPKQMQPIYNNVQSQRALDNPSSSPSIYSTQQTQQIDGGKPTSVGSLYIAPLAPNLPSSPANNYERSQQNNGPARPTYSPQQQAPAQPQQLRWMSSQPVAKTQPEWAHADDNSNVMPSSLRMKTPPPPSLQQQIPQAPVKQQPVMSNQSYQNPSNNQQFYSNNFVGPQGSGNAAPTGLRLQISTPITNNISNTSMQSGPKERIIPIVLEQTPTSNPSAFNFNTTATYASSNGNNGIGASYVVRSPNQFVDQGYNNFQTQQAGQRLPPNVTTGSPMGANRQTMMPAQPGYMTNKNIGPTANAPKSRVIPISIESSNDGLRDTMQQSPIVLQNDSRTPPIQSKSFRILQKITDTVDDGTSDEPNNRNASQTSNFNDNEPAQLQRPHYARQMSAQLAKNNEQMRHLEIGKDEDKNSSTSNRYIQRNIYEHQQSQQQAYIPPSEQIIPEPKKYTGSAIPSRSFKLLQALTTPENAGPGQSDL